MSAPAEPYVAVIFSSLHRGVALDEYAAATARMEELAAQQPGFLGIESARGADGFGITVSYWRSEDDAREWKRHSEHVSAQTTGHTTWYERYRVRVATVTRDYSFDGADQLLHLAVPADWAAARETGVYRTSTRGRTLDEEGFVHCSYPGQLEGVANRFYADLSEVVVLHIDPELLDAEIRVEPAAGRRDELFPHVYGPIPTSAVTATTPWHRGVGDTWRRPVEF